MYIDDTERRLQAQLKLAVKKYQNAKIKHQIDPCQKTKKKLSKKEDVVRQILNDIQKVSITS